MIIGVPKETKTDEYRVGLLAVGAQIVDSAEEIYARAEMIVKVKEPQPAEITAVAYETLRDPHGRLPLLTPMSEVAGKMSIHEGAKYLERPMMGRGILLGGVPGVAPANVLILGGGVVGTNVSSMKPSQECTRIWREVEKSPAVIHLKCQSRPPVRPLFKS